MTSSHSFKTGCTISKMVERSAYFDLRNGLRQDLGILGTSEWNLIKAVDRAAMDGDVWIEDGVDIEKPIAKDKNEGNDNQKSDQPHPPRYSPR